MYCIPASTLSPPAICRAASKGTADFCPSICNNIFFAFALKPSVFINSFDSLIFLSASSQSIQYNSLFFLLANSALSVFFHASKSLSPLERLIEYAVAPRFFSLFAKLADCSSVIEKRTSSLSCILFAALKCSTSNLFCSRAFPFSLTIKFFSEIFLPV